MKFSSNMAMAELSNVRCFPVRQAFAALWNFQLLGRQSGVRPGRTPSGGSSEPAWTLTKEVMKKADIRTHILKRCLAGAVALPSDMGRSSANRLFYPPPITPAQQAKATAYVSYVCARFCISRDDRQEIWLNFVPIGNRLLERSRRNTRPHGPWSKPWLYTRPVATRQVARRHFEVIHAILDRYQVPNDLRSEYLKSQLVGVAITVHRGIAELESQGHLGGSADRH